MNLPAENENKKQKAKQNVKCKLFVRAAMGADVKKMEDKKKCAHAQTHTHTHTHTHTGIHTHTHTHTLADKQR